MKKIEKEDMNISQEEAKGLKNVRVASIFIVIFSLAAFLAITYFTGIIGESFGKTGENIALGIIGLLLILALYKTNKDID